MKQATGATPPADTQTSFLSKAASEESLSEKTLTPVVTESVETVLDEIPTPIKHPPEEIPISTTPTIESTPKESDLQQEVAKALSGGFNAAEVFDQPVASEPEIGAEQAEEVVDQILYLVDFCRIEPDEATEVVKSGYGELFKIAASAGIPVPLLRDVFLKYIPFVRTSEGEEKLQTLTGERLLDIFSAHLKNKLDETHFIKCLIMAIESPTTPIREIVQREILPAIEKAKAIEKKEPKKKPIPAKIAVPVEVESADGIITLPDAQGVSFKVEYLDDSQNVNLTFFLRNPSGQIETIGSSTVSAKINSEEILYLLAYEMNLFSLGYFENGATSMAFSAKLIHQTIKKMKDQHLKSSVEVPTKKKRVEAGYLTDTIDYIVPMTLDPDLADGDYFLLPDTEQLAFSVERSPKQGLTISFTQRGYPIGSVNIIESINHKQLSGLLREAMQLPIESPGAVDFAARMIKVIIGELVTTKREKLPRRVTADVGEKEEAEEETSDKLRHYLSMLEKD
jgi:hypothetical protein